MLSLSDGRRNRRGEKTKKTPRIRPSRRYMPLTLHSPERLHSTRAPSLLTPQPALRNLLLLRASRRPATSQSPRPPVALVDLPMAWAEHK